MALADIVERIAGDARSEAEAIVRAAEEAAEAILARATTDAEADARRIRDRAAREAKAEAETVVAAARLRARDKLVAMRRELVGRVLGEATEKLLAQPDERYAEFLARGILESARGGETVMIAEADRPRIEGVLPAAVSRLAGEAGRDVALTYSGEPAPGMEHGVLLTAPRVRVEVSPQATLAAREDELTMLAARVLFGGGG